MSVVRHSRGSLAGVAGFMEGLVLGAAGLSLAAGAAHGEPAAPALAAAAQASSPLRRVAVFGKDQRTSLPAQHRGLRQQIGLLYEPRSHSICTAFCVANDIIATAAHCLFRTAGEQPLPLASITFRVDAQKARNEVHLAGAETGDVMQHVMAGSVHPNVRPPIDATRDWAFARLARPVCSAGGLKLGVRTTEEIADLAAQNRVYQVAFHRDFNNWELAYSPCAVRLDVEGVDRISIRRDFVDAHLLLLHTCDSGGGSSGSPLLINGPSGPEAVGINVGTYVQSKVMMQNDEVVRRFRPDEIANTGVNVSFLVPRFLMFEKARIVRERSRIRELQERLARAGFPSGPADGRYGSDLKAAIEAYEQAQRLAVTGLATEALLRRLTGSSAPFPRSLGAAAVK